MSRLLTLYVLRQMAVAFAFATGGVTFVVLFVQSFRLLSMVIDNAGTILVFFQLLGLSGLTFLPLIMPLGLGTAAVFVYHKMATDSELTVMRSAGLSSIKLVTPALVFAGMVMTVCFALTVWIAPNANRSLVTLQYKMRDSYAVFLSHPGSFNDLSTGLTFYANKRGAGGSLQGILIHDVRNPDVPTTTMAATGRVIDGGGEPQLIIFNGKRQELDRATGKLSEMAFDQYVLDLAALRNTTSERMSDPREQTVAELLDPSPEMLRWRGPISHFKAELHTRFATPFLSLSYTLIGLSSILVGSFNRRGMGGRILASAITIIVTQAFFMTANAFVGRHDGFLFLLYLIALLPAPAGLVLLNDDGWNLRRLPRFLGRVFS